MAMLQIWSKYVSVDHSVSVRLTEHHYFCSTHCYVRVQGFSHQQTQAIGSTKNLNRNRMFLLLLYNKMFIFHFLLFDVISMAVPLTLQTN